VALDLREGRERERERERERMKAYCGLLEGEPPCRHRTSELRKGESLVLPDL